MKFNLTQVGFIMKSLRQQAQDTLEPLKKELYEAVVPREPTILECADSLRGIKKATLRTMLTLGRKSPAMEIFEATVEEQKEYYYSLVNHLNMSAERLLDDINQQLLFEERENPEFPTILMEIVDQKLTERYKELRDA